MKIVVKSEVVGMSSKSFKDRPMEKIEEASKREQTADTYTRSLSKNDKFEPFPHKWMYFNSVKSLGIPKLLSFPI